MKKIRFIFSFILVLSACSHSDSSLNVFNEVSNQVSIEINSQPKSSPVIRNESCKVSITHDQLQDQKELAFKFPEQCDSIQISVPPGGTLTNAELYTDSISREEVASIPGFMFGGNPINYFTLSHKLKGRFYLRYSSCHWSSQLWITIE